MAISYAEGMALVEKRCVPVEGLEQIPLGDALGRILGSELTSPMDYPPADNSAVDGYAVRHGDLASGAPLRLAGVSAAGHPYFGRIGQGEAVRIFTGALVPPDADTVAMQEDVTRSGDTVLIPAGSRAGAHIRRTGEDIEKDASILNAGTRLGPAQIGLLASLGIGAATVRRRPRIAVMSVGDELLAPGEAPRPGTIYESNRPLLLGLLAGLGVIVSDLGIVPDKEDAVRQALVSAAAGHDAIISSAGVSVGDEDHVRRALLSVGEIDFAGLAIKPGKPLVLGHAAGTPFFGLPGNPVAVATCFAIAVRQGILRLSGDAAHAAPRFSVRADFSLQRKPGPREFLRVMLQDSHGETVARLFPRRSAGSVSAMAGSDGLVEIAEDQTQIEPGMSVPFLPFGLVGL